MKIIIISGDPGSGKTSEAKKILDTLTGNSAIYDECISFDEIPKIVASFDNSKLDNLIITTNQKPF